MTRVQKKCLSASLALHALLLAILLLGPAFSRREASSPSAPVLEILPADLKLTMDETVHGGTAPASPPKQTSPPPQPQPNVTAKPPEPPKPEPAPRIKVAPEPERSAPKPQDQEPGRKPEQKPEKDPSTVDARNSKPGIKVSTNKVVLTDADRKKRETAERDAAAAAERDRIRRAAGQIAKQLGQSEANLKGGLSSTTEITMPGPGGGGALSADYRSYLQAFYQAQWNSRKPANVGVKLALVKARITIAHDGTVTAHTIYEPCGINAVDDSVRRVLKENKQLKPLPADAPEGEITVTITFKVEGDTSA